MKEIFKKFSALNNLRKKGTSLTLGNDQLLAEKVRIYPCLYSKTSKITQRKEWQNEKVKKDKNSKIKTWQTLDQIKIKNKTLKYGKGVM